jgi:hypothetical protein
MRTRGLPVLSKSRFQLVLSPLRALPITSGQLTRRSTLRKTSTVMFEARSSAWSGTVTTPPA